MSRAAQLWADNADFAEVCRTHPFVQGIATGELARDGFVFYVEQDPFFLGAFSRAYALGAGWGRTCRVAVSRSTLPTRSVRNCQRCFFPSPYNDPEFEALAGRMEALLDRFDDGGQQAARHYRAAMAREYDFFDQAGGTGGR